MIFLLSYITSKLTPLTQYKAKPPDLFSAFTQKHPLNFKHSLIFSTLGDFAFDSEKKIISGLSLLTSALRALTVGALLAPQQF